MCKLGPSPFMNFGTGDYSCQRHAKVLTVVLSQPNTHKRSAKSFSFTVSSNDTPTFKTRNSKNYYQQNKEVVIKQFKITWVSCCQKLHTVLSSKILRLICRCLALSKMSETSPVPDVTYNDEQDRTIIIII